MLDRIWTGLMLLSLCLWREARGASAEARRGIAHVILNRVADKRKRWPNTIDRVILQEKQFSSFNPGDPNATKYPDAANPVDWRAWLDCCTIANAPGDDSTGGANHYHSIPEDKPQPKWADPKKLTVEIGPFKFYKL